MLSSKLYILRSGAATIALASVAGPLFAQEAASSGAIEEIVVTAQRRAQNLEETPVAVNALSATALDNLGIHTEADLQFAVPGLTIRASLDSNQLNYAIRGQTIDAFSSSQPAVQPYIDEIPVNGLSASTFYDLDSTQVLKGPQGTLFGRNTTGGAVLFTTTKPNLDEIEGYVDASLGNYNYKELKAAVNVPIVDGKLAVRLAVDGDFRDGFAKNLFDNSTVGDVDRQGYRVSILLHPIDSFTNNLVVDYAHIGGSASPGVLYWVTPVGYKNGGAPANDTGAIFYSPLLDSVFGPGSWAKYLAANPQLQAYPKGIQQYLATQEARGPYVVDLNGHPTVNNDNLLISNTSTYDVTPDLQLKNIFGFVKIRQDQSNIDWDGSPYLLENTSDHDFNQDSRTITEEFQVQGKIFDQKLTYVAGLYFEGDQFWTRLNVDFFGLKPVYSAHTNYDTVFKSESLAGYAQGTYDLGDLIPGLGVTAGYRLTRGQSSEDQLPGSAFNNNPLAADHAAQELNKISYQFGIQEQFNPNLLVYAVTRRSFRTGGFAQSGPVENPDTPANGGTEFFPEEAYDVEVGAKFQDRFDDIPVRLNLALYNMWIDNVQRTDYQTFPLFGIAGLTANVPQAQVQGFEVDGAISPTPWLSFGANVAYTDARFTKPDATYFGNTVTYGPYPDSPRWTGSANATVRIPLPDPDMGELSVRGDVYGQTNFFFGSLNNTSEPGTKVPGYGIANFRVGLDAIGGTSLSLAAYVKNAFDHVYWVGGIPTSGVYSTNEAVAGEPRTFYVEAHFDFGGSSSEAPEVEPPPPPPAPPPVAPPAAPVEAKRSFQVFFDFDKSNITDAAAQVILAAADAVKAGHVVQITVTGHTDTVGTAAYNQGLSERRAEAVKGRLVTDGVSGGEITTIGVGKTGLLVPTADGVREPQNRRAEILLQ